ncbi:hypothetical protein SAMN06297387_102110 [Streptomyces zhaozhouensis]|uniref:Uncharacterized protein n=1 Tax=Streptomyces zhaozhouensis TaxID=1300267 RepID=A0A286DNT6_9ACTN|nr:hypothetical protein [Streptomyces zhaozhouensis]SOD60377.1 hypothetical protein SAMN06297387_102110 [Streptomyces zhaozhouensis]
MRRYRGVPGSRRIRAAWASLGAGVCLLGAGACAGADADGARDDGGGRASPSAAERDGGVEQRPCARPEGGWIADPARTDASDLAAVTERARELDAYAGVWTAYIDQEELEGEGHPSTDPGNVIVAAAYTGDPAGHEAELRALWGGGLCLVEAEHTHAELDEVRDALADDFPGIDNPVVDQPDNVVSAVTAEITPELRAAVEERFGEGVVRLEEGEHEPARPN